MPLMLAGILIVGGAMALAVAGLLATRKLVRPRVSEQHNVVAGVLFQMVGVLYAIVLAFVVFAVWQRFTDADTAVTAEATAAVLAFRDTHAFPEPLRQEAQDALRRYLAEGVEVEWEGSGTDAVQAHVRPDVMNPIWQVYRRLQPTTQAEAQRYLEAEMHLADLERQRHLRHLASASSLEDIFWVALIVGAILTTGFSYFFHMDNLAMHAMMTGLTAALMALLLFLIGALNQPFTGPVRVSMGAYEHAIEMFNAQNLDTSDATAPASGGPAPGR